MDFQTILATDPILNPLPTCLDKTLRVRRHTMQGQNPACGISEPWVPSEDLMEIPAGSLGDQEDAASSLFQAEE